MKAPATLPAISARKLPSSRIPFPQDKRLLREKFRQQTEPGRSEHAACVLARNTAAKAKCKVLSQQRDGGKREYASSKRLTSNTDGDHFFAVTYCAEGGT
jgi:hypothetical protein